MNNSTNKYFLDELRNNSCYPTFRVVVNIATYVLYAAAVVAIISSVSSGAIHIGILVAVLIVVIAKVAQEVSLMVADIADATVFSSSKLLPDTGANATQFEGGHKNKQSTIKTNNFFVDDNEKNLNDSRYQLYLVDKFKITKNEVLSKFILEGNPFNSLNEALERASFIDDENQKKDEEKRKKEVEAQVTKSNLEKLRINEREESDIQSKKLEVEERNKKQIVKKAKATEIWILISFFLILPLFIWFFRDYVAKQELINKKLDSEKIIAPQSNDAPVSNEKYKHDGINRL